MRNIIKYVGIVLVIAGILLVMKNLFTKDESFNEINNKSKNKYYDVKIELLDEESNAYLKDATLVLKRNSGEIIEKWNTGENVHLVDKMKNGTYVITQESAPEGYHLNEEGVTFEVKNKDKKVTMYNKKMTEEEIEEEKIKNTTSSEVSVDNTLSEKSIWAIVGGVISIGVGMALILIQKKSSNNDI